MVIERMRSQHGRLMFYNYRCWNFVVIGTWRPELRYRRNGLMIEFVVDSETVFHDYDNLTA